MFRIVFLCTGNRARSVIAEHAARRASDGLDLYIGSAGVMDLGAIAALPEAVDAARRFGLDLSAHRSRCMTAAELEATDLVVGFERDHVAAAVVDGGADPSRTFTLRELLRLLEGLDEGSAPDPVENARLRIESAARARERNRSFNPDDDIADPLGRNPDYFVQVADEITTGVTRLLSVLFGHSADRPGETDRASR